MPSNRGDHQQQTSSRHQVGVSALGLSCISAAVAETVTYPIDAVKTQLQLQRSTIQANGGGKPAGAWRIAKQVVQSYGVSGLYAGLSPAVLRHFVYTGVSCDQHSSVTEWCGLPDMHTFLMISPDLHSGRQRITNLTHA